MKYIKNNKLFLGTKLSTIKNNLDDIIRYIYDQYYLNHNKMVKLYDHIEFDNNNNNNNYANNIIFKNNPVEDKKYVFLFDDLLNIDILGDCDYKNKKLIIELHNYLILNKSFDLILNNINKVKLINNSGMNKNYYGSTYLDLKLHYWDQYIINNNDKSIRLHDLIIALYKIRSHKFSDSNEQYNEISELDIFKNVRKKELVVVINFNHYDIP